MTCDITDISCKSLRFVAQATLARWKTLVGSNLKNSLAQQLHLIDQEVPESFKRKSANSSQVDQPKSSEFLGDLG